MTGDEAATDETDICIKDMWRGPSEVLTEMNEVVVDPGHSEIFMELAAEIVSAYVSNNSVPTSELPTLIGDVHAALMRVTNVRAPASVEPLKPAVPVKKSIMEDYITCLEDGKRFKSLKRHLRTRYDMSPDEYREKWGLDADYPMVAPNYARARSQLAKNMGLGQQRRRATQ